MNIRWSPAAAENLSRIFEYIRPDNPSAAERVVRTIYDSAGSLGSFPYRGRTGRVEGTRELVLPSLPFVIVYRVLDDAVEIAAVIHGAQRWPPEV
jgi:addiction module RelE/StbE family toxin